jgi:hypothetical protein
MKRLSSRICGTRKVDKAMISVKRLRELLANVPDEAIVIAYEGEGCGLRVVHGKNSGWINTGWSDEVCVDDSPEHDLSEFEGDTHQ